jgi:type VI secretion system secreted protein Hcp
MFLMVEGVEGESQDSRHANQIDVLAWSWGASNTVTVSGGGGGAGRVSVSDLTVTKPLDKASPKLLLNVCNGRHIPRATLAVRRSGAEFDYLKIELEDVIITALSTAGSSGETSVTESVSMKFGKFRVTYTPQDATGKPGTPVVSGWDITQNIAY